MPCVSIAARSNKAAGIATTDCSGRWTKSSSRRVRTCSSNGGRPVSGLLKRLDVLVGQANAAALFGQHTAKAQTSFGVGVLILRHAAKSSSAIRPSSGGLLIFFKNRAKVAFLAPRSSA